MVVRLWVACHAFGDPLFKRLKSGAKSRPSNAGGLPQRKSRLWVQWCLAAYEERAINIGCASGIMRCGVVVWSGEDYSLKDQTFRMVLERSHSKSSGVKASSFRMRSRDFW